MLWQNKLSFAKKHLTPSLPKAVFFGVFLMLLMSIGNAQMRQIHLEPFVSNNTIHEFSFYSASHGYIAGDDNGSPWVGFTSDSGRTYIKRFITFSNVNTGSYTVSLPFLIEGVRAFSQDTIVVYGGFNITPAVLYSTDGGLTYLLTYHFQGANQAGLISDMVFPQNNAIGYATDGYRIIKTTNKGQTWATSFVDNAGFINILDATDNNNVFAFSNASGSKLYKTSNAGTSWQPVTIPGLYLFGADFITPLKGWINVYYNDSSLIYYTSNSGSSWVNKNDGVASPVAFYQFRFVNDSTGYGLGGNYSTFKTLDSGRVWEPLPRDNNYSYFSYSHEEIQTLGENQVWCGSEKEFIELTVNGGGTPFPKAFFKIDTVGVASTSIVKLLNFSRRIYTYKWYVNNVLVSTAYNTTFNHSISNAMDTVKLVVSNGTTADSVIHIQYYGSLISITNVSPITAATGTLVAITGTGFSGATSVTFGGVPAASFTVNSSTSITATVGNGATGTVKVVSPNGQATYTGFTYIPFPTITSFSPGIAGNGFTIIITGTNFTGVTSVKFGTMPAGSFTVINSTTISAVVSPSGASGSVSVTTPGGTASLAGFIYIPAPTITAISPTIGGPGTIVSITGTDFIGVTSVKFGGVNAASFTVNSPTSITATVAGGATGGANIVTAYGSGFSSQIFTFNTLPVINNISPRNGPVGSAVTITGANFAPATAGNIVYFGPVRATVITATSNVLTVIVPVAASTGFISLLANGLYTLSPVEFNLTFPGDPVLTSNSFSGQINFTSGSGVADLATADFDGDGKPDIVSVNKEDKTISFFRNTSTVSNLSFAPRIDSSSGTYKPVKISLGDINGDGKIDIAVIAQDPAAPILSGRLILYRNTSIPGVISFASRVEIECGSNPIDVIFADYTNDRKQDIFVLNDGTFNLTLFRNSSSGQSVSFVMQNTVSVSSGSNYVRSLSAADFDADGRIDIAIGNTTNLAFILNNSTSTFSSSNVVFYPTGFFSGAFNDIVVTDLDVDGRTDIVGNDLVFKNQTIIPGNLSFSWQSGTGSGYTGCMSGLNGDSKPDFLRISTPSNITAFRNTSTVGSISLVSDATYTTTQPPGPIITADFDLDHRPDILFGQPASNNVSILKSQVQFIGPAIYSFTPTTGITGTVVTITGVNFTGATAVSFGGVAASSFSIVNSTTITAVVANGNSGIVSVTTPSGMASLEGFTYGTTPSITSFLPTITGTGTSVTITGANFTGATAVSFGGTAASSFTVVNASTITAVVASGASGSVSVTTPNGSATLTGFTFIPAPTITSFTPTNGGNGTLITITGTNFSANTSVQFGGVAATSFTFINSTTITAVVSFAGASGNVSVTTQGGTASLSGFLFFYPPSITSFTPTSGATGATITITGNNFTGATAVSFGGTAAASFTAVNATTVTAVVANGSSGNVSVTTPGGTFSLGGFTYSIVTATGGPGSINSPALTVSPNPGADKIVIRHPASVKKTTIHFIDMLGRTVKQLEPVRSTDNTTTTIKSFGSGMFIIMWTDGTRVLTRTFVKE